ncbi:hypothetical protein AB0M02_25640 [Actinoplanes sp. NPDC051861]|uniref:hypothetical protein n=1 Tax=Actinoplanes sp. NPDC051861 TaxID=3155170 RepID=UPI0034309D78
MSMTVSAATASAWNSYAAWGRLQSASGKLTADLSPVPASEAVLTADRAAVVNAAHEVARIEARRASDVARLKASNATFDFLV